MLRDSRLLLGLSALGLSGALVGCGQAGSSSGTAGQAASSAAASLASAASSAAGSVGSAAASGASSVAGAASSGAAAAGQCQPATGQELVVLEDDKKLQTVDNVIPAINAKAATPPLMAALDSVAGMTTEELVGLNRKVVVERGTAAKVAKEYVESKGLGAAGGGGSGSIVVGAANFAENEILANVYAEVLKGAGFDASVRKIGNRELYLPALEKGELQVVPEYAGTLTEFLNKKANGSKAKPKASGELDATVQALTALGDKVGLKFGKPAQAADQNAFAVTKAFAEKNELTTLSDLSKCNGGKLVLGGPSECPERPFCKPGLEDTYGLKFSEFSTLDAGGPLTQAALRQGKIQVGLVFSSDGGLAGR